MKLIRPRGTSGEHATVMLPPMCLRVYKGEDFDLAVAQ